MKTPVLLILFILIFSVCKKDTPVNRANAEIFKFNSQKCMCCWGWYVKKAGDTLIIDSIPSGVNIPMDITLPIPVYIELGSLKLDCPKYDYYKVNKLAVIK